MIEADASTGRGVDIGGALTSFVGGGLRCFLSIRSSDKGVVTVECPAAHPDVDNLPEEAKKAKMSFSTCDGERCIEGVRVRGGWLRFRVLATFFWFEGWTRL